MKLSRYLLALVIAGCGSTTIDPIEGAAGSSGSGGSGATATGGGSGTGGGASGNGGDGANGGSSGSGGSGGSLSTGCSTPNPAGCVQTGCSSGFVCDTTSSECKSSSCTCDEIEDSWICDPDCGGGMCVPDGTNATHFVRFGYWQGQEATGEFCVAYSGDLNQPNWEPVGLLAQNGLLPTDFEGLDALSRYVPLTQQPLFFGKAYSSCSGLVKQIEAPQGTHFTLLSVPYSFEADTLWVVVDPGMVPAQTGLRVVNASPEANPLEVTVDGHSLGSIPFANSPVGYSDITAAIGSDHVSEITVKNPSGASGKLSYTTWDLLPLKSVTLYLSGYDFKGYTALACFDAAPNQLPAGKLSNCWFVQED